MSTDSPRLAREKRTLEAMVGIYCSAHHMSEGTLCVECSELLQYAYCRLDRCPFGAQKPTCAKCPIHCYKPSMREKARNVMRFAGPRMLYRHPWLAARHWLDSLRRSERSA